MCALGGLTYGVRQHALGISCGCTAIQKRPQIGQSNNTEAAPVMLGEALETMWALAREDMHSCVDLNSQFQTRKQMHLPNRIQVILQQVINRGLDCGFGAWFSGGECAVMKLCVLSTSYKNGACVLYHQTEQ